jgi:hypothetical protein
MPRHWHRGYVPAISLLLTARSSLQAPCGIDPLCGLILTSQAMKTVLIQNSSQWWHDQLLRLWYSLVSWFRTEPVLVLSLALLGGILGLGVNHFIGPRRFEVAAGLTVSTGDGTQLQSGIAAALAASTGLQLGATAPPLRFQTALFESAPFSDSLLLEPLSLNLKGCLRQPCTLYQSYSDKLEVTPKLLAKARDRLAKRLTSIRDERSQILYIRSQHADSATARAALTQSIELLGRLNRQLVADAAESRVAFLSAQVPRLEANLTTIQDSLERFYRQNVSLGNSPELHFREERLRRSYQAQSDLLSDVRSQLSQGEIQARGGLQLVELVIPPYLDGRPRRPLRNVALVVGASLALCIRFLLWSRHRSRS